MKKALISILLSIILSAGIIFSADSITIQAEESHEFIESMVVSGRDVFFEVEHPNVANVIVEYSYQVNELLFSKLVRLRTQKVSIDTSTGLTKYYFRMPSEALSFKIWRLGNNSTISSTANGEYIRSEASALSNVDLRVKQLIIDNDLITKEFGYTSDVATRAYKFVMHFDIIDEEGNPVNISNIIRVNVRFNVVQKGLINSTTSKEITIEENEVIVSSWAVFPYFKNEIVKTNISRSFDSRYTWMIDLGTYKTGIGLPGGFLADVTLDKTQLLTIDYVFDGVFFNDQVVIDEPYDQDDVLHVNPGTTDPYTNIFDSIGNLFDNLSSAFNIMIIIIISIAAIVVLTLFSKVFSIVSFVGKAIIKLIQLKLKILKYLMVDIPGYLIKFILFLIIPKEKRKEHIYVSRHL